MTDATESLKHLPLTLTTRRSRPRVRWADDEGDHERELDRKILLGCSAHVHAVIRDRSVSRLHAELELRDGGVWVRDLGSTNGTWLNGVLVQAARVPEDGLLRLGTVTVRVDYSPAPQRVNLWPADHFGAAFGASEPMRELFYRMQQCLSTDAPILLRGETGTGKELIARSLHAASSRADAPFVIVDCAGLPERWIERELFGDTTGEAPHVGALESAAGGTVLFDEIGELPLALQSKLLRIIESASVRRLGETTERAIDVRFISATHHDLQSMVSARAFREDLYFRLAVLPLDVPPLRERRDDAIVLLERMLAGVAVGLDEDTKRIVAEHRWLGNVRELRNFAERVRSIGLAAAKTLLEGGDAPTLTSPPRGQPTTTTGLPSPPLDRTFKDVRESWNDHLERSYIGGMLRIHGRNIGAIADAAGLDRSYVHRLIRKHDL